MQRILAAQGAANLHLSKFEVQQKNPTFFILRHDLLSEWHHSEGK